MLSLRIATAAVLFLILGFSIWAGPLAFAGVMAIAFGLALFEWLRIGNLGPVPAALISAVEMVTQFSLYWAGALPRMDWFLFIVDGVVMLAWFVIFFVELFTREKGFKVNVIQCQLSAVVFVPAAYLSFLWLNEYGGWVLVLSVMCIIWGADIFAYFCGRAWGKHKLCPAISPKKTWEGVIGAYILVIIYFLLCYWFCDQKNVFTNFVFEHAGFIWGVIILAMLIALSIAGDLFESMLKRLAGIKDSSNLLPGHGGFYDRMDSSMPVIPTATWIMITIMLFA
ncbi:phosphatidate cytidylyltransferase [Sutterella sp.]|uniref:phosphatidate cytidylyltransferase n=1 Tax=Sutterella sp. TaxID=1981025 RepID=UPI0026E108FB|nr:phosphatidate cytidylyltransferase [Sutterella sp.]MDO5530870.1 phosphatidate cytidylyltransferase [Sutterella sp.]